MPPIRPGPAIRPVRTERTHEENQERAYIAASRRSDRSLEARVESARRASEIHKKRTGRSLRVREEDVMNEEMYEEEDDDLPMQYRRISALNPSLQYTQLNERVNSYLAGQVGVRNYLYSAIWNANQNQYANQMFNPLMQHPNNMQAGTMSPQAINGQANGQQSPFQMSGMNTSQQGPHQRSASIATTQELANYTSTQTAPMNTGFDARRMSMNNVQSPGILSPTATSSHPPTPHGQQRSNSDPQQVPTPPQSGQTPQPQGGRASVASPSGDSDHYPLTTKLPIEAQQLLDGSSMANSVHASQFTAGIPMPSMSGYGYHSDGKKDAGGSNEGSTGLSQTLTPFNFYNSQQQMSFAEPQSAVSAPGNLDFGMNSSGYDDLAYDPNVHFDMNFGAGSNPGTAQNSGQVTPNEGNWNESDFFNYAAASD